MRPHLTWFGRIEKSPNETWKPGGKMWACHDTLQRCSSGQRATLSRDLLHLLKGSHVFQLYQQKMFWNRARSLTWSWTLDCWSKVTDSSISSIKNCITHIESAENTPINSLDSSEGIHLLEHRKVKARQGLRKSLPKCLQPSESGIKV